MTRVLVFVACTSVLLGCAQTTRVLVEVDAELDVREDARYRRTHISVTALGACGDQGAGEVLALDVNPSGGAQSWPARVELLPCAGDATRRYEVVATADEEVPGTTPREYSPFVAARARSSYVAGQTRILRMTLQASCRDVLFCGDDETCNDGRCALADIAPMTLPQLGDPPADARVMDGGRERDAADAPSPLDVALDAPRLDATESLDAGNPTDSTVPLEPDAHTLDPDAYLAPDAYESLDAFTPTDAYQPPDAYDLPDAAPRACAATYGGLPGYVQCNQTATTCEFWTSGGCYAGCTAVGAGSPLDCWDDSGGRCIRGSVTACVNTSIICLCDRIP